MMLQHKRVLVTRPAHQAANLCHIIEAQGGKAVCLPCIAIEPNTDAMTEIQAGLLNLPLFNWLIFISANAVNFALQANDGKIPNLNGVQIAAIGKATAQALNKMKMPVDIQPAAGFNSAALLAMPQMQKIAGQSVLIVRGVGGREELAETLRQRGAARVDYLEVYKRIIPHVDKTPLLALLAANKMDVITVTSGESLQNLLTMLEGCYHAQLFKLPLVVVSERIRQLAITMGFKQIFLATSPSDEAIVESVIECVTGELSGRIE